MMSTQATASGLNNFPGNYFQSAHRSFVLKPLEIVLGQVSSQLCQLTRGGARKYWVRRGFLVPLLGALWMTGTACQQAPAGPTRKIVLQQTWELNSGDLVSGHLITGGLGDITVNLNHASIRAPFAGKAELAAEGAQCIYFSTPDIPAYLFRYCGVKNPKVGPLSPGEVMGRGRQIHFATLRRQPDGTWAIVEPSNQVLEKTLSAPQRPSIF